MLTKESVFFSFHPFVAILSFHSGRTKRCCVADVSDFCLGPLRRNSIGERTTDCDQAVGDPHRKEVQRILSALSFIATRDSKNKKQREAISKSGYKINSSKMSPFTKPFITGRNAAPWSAPRPESSMQEKWEFCFPK